jgi:hypothetical protein
MQDLTPIRYRFGPRRVIYEDTLRLLRRARRP